MKQTYHMNCFLCSQCHQPIGSNSFHNEDGKIYCQKGSRGYSPSGAVFDRSGMALLNLLMYIMSLYV